MAFSLKSETQHEIEQQMVRRGFSDPDELVMTALSLLDDETETSDFEDLDEETRAAIERASLQPDITAEQAEARILGRGPKAGGVR
jgi:hypothetical protein